MKQDMLISELLGNRYGNVYVRAGLTTPRDIIDAIKEHGIYVFGDGLPCLALRGEGKKTRQALADLLDDLNFPWRDYIKNGRGKRTEHQFRFEIDRRIYGLIGLLKEYKELRSIEPVSRTIIDLADGDHNSDSQ